MRAKPATAVSVLICVLLSGLAACDNTTEEADGTQPPSASATVVKSTDQVVTMREPDWWIPPAASVERLFVNHSVVVGEVTGVERPFDPASRLYTVFAVRVEATLRGENIGDTIYIAQTGGAWEGVVYEEKGNSLLRQGARYILTVDAFSGIAADADFHGYYLSQPFAQFLLDSGSLEPKDETWANLPAVAELTGRTLDEARGIVAGLAEPTPIADELLLAVIRAIPVPPDAEQPSQGAIGAEGKIALAAFVATTTIDDVFTFYQGTLASLGWSSEIGPQVVSYPDKGGTGVTTIGSWTLTKDDLRLVLVTGQTPKDAPAGEIATQLRVEPVWSTGLESYSIPSVCALPSSISGLRPTSSVCGSP
jgi:hypothetical protein